MSRKRNRWTNCHSVWNLHAPVYLMLLTLYDNLRKDCFNNRNFKQWRFYILLRQEIASCNTSKFSVLLPSLSMGLFETINKPLPAIKIIKISTCKDIYSQSPIFTVRHRSGFFGGTLAENKRLLPKHIREQILNYLMTLSTPWSFYWFTTVKHESTVMGD